MNLRRVLRGGLTSIIAAALIIVLAPFFGLQSNAAGEYGIWIGDQQFSSSTTRIYGESGYADYNTSTKTITFNDFEIGDNVYEKSEIKYQLYAEVDGLNIKGSAKLNNNNCNYGIYNIGNLTIEEDADIEVSAGQYGIEVYGDDKIFRIEGKVSVEYTVGSFGDGIRCDNIYVYKTGYVSSVIHGCWCDAIKAKNSINVEGKINAVVDSPITIINPEESCGIRVTNSYGYISFFNGCEVNASASGRDGIGVYSEGEVAIYNCDLKAEGVKNAIKTDFKKIYKDITAYIKTPSEAALSVDEKYFIDNGYEVNSILFKKVDWYDIRVGKYWINSDYKDDIPGIIGGSASYDPIDMVLTFKGKVTGVTGYTGTSLVYVEDYVTIKGNAILDSSDADTALEYFSSGGTLTIDGDLKLKGYKNGLDAQGTPGTTVIVNGKLTADSYSENAIYCKNMRINSGGEVSAFTNNPGYVAVFADGEIVLDGGMLEAEAEKDSVCAVKADGGIKVEAGTLNASVKGKTATAIRGKIEVNGGIVSAISSMPDSKAVHGDVMVYGGSLNATADGTGTCAIKGYVTLNTGELKAEVKNNSNSEDYVVNGDTTINSGKFTINGTCSGINSFSFSHMGGTSIITAGGKCGINASNYLFSNGNLMVKGNNYGIYSSGSVGFSGGTVKAEGSDNAVYTTFTDGIYLINNCSITEPYNGKTVSYTSYTTITKEDGNTAAKTVTIEGVEKYPVYVGSTQVTSGNKNNIEGIIGGGTAKYDPDTNTLTFDGNVEGVTGIHNNCLIYSETGLTIKGDATLSDTSANYAVVVSLGNLIIEGNIEAESDYHNIVTYNGSVSIPGSLKSESLNGFAIRSQKSVKVTGNLDVTSYSGYAVYSDEGDVILAGKSVQITSTQDSGIYSGKNIMIKSGITKLWGKNRVVKLNSGGLGKISIAEDLKISVPEGGKLSADRTWFAEANGYTEPIYVQIEPAPVYKATFDANGFGTAPEEQSVYEGKRVTKPDDITAECHVFDGWFTDSACTAAYDFDTPVTADITLYAGWTEKHKLNKVYKYPTCTEPGYMDPYYECEDCGKWFKDEDGLILIADYDAGLLPATGHLIDPDDATYEWSEDGHTCTAKAFCIKCGEAKEVATYVPGDASSKITATVKVPATTEKMGVTTYTATFETEGFEVQTKDVEDIPVIIPGSDPTPTPGGEATPGGESTPTPGGEATPAPEGGATPTPTPTAAPVEYKKDEIVKDEESNASYKISSTTSKTVVFYSFVNKNVTDFEIPAEVTLGGKKYKVTEIAPNAFKNNKKLKKFTIGKNIKKIGKNAFYGCKNLKSITVKTTKLTKKSVGKNAFKKIHKKAKIKVPKKKLKAYKKIFKARGVNGKKQKITK